MFTEGDGSSVPLVRGESVFKTLVGLGLKAQG